MSNTKIVAMIVGLSLLILVGGVALASRAPQPVAVQSSQEAKVEVDGTSYDWGTIPIDGGNVVKTFTIRNVGTGTLELANVQTSCMCTEAQVVIDGEKSPFFGMHAKSSWVGKLTAGSQAELVVTFDPAYHGPAGIGQITRVVSMSTNDASRPKLEFTLAANVIKS